MRSSRYANCEDIRGSDCESMPRFVSQSWCSKISFTQRRPRKIRDACAMHSAPAAEPRGSAPASRLCRTSTNSLIRFSNSRNARRKANFCVTASPSGRAGSLIPHCARIGLPGKSSQRRREVLPDTDDEIHPRRGRRRELTRAFRLHVRDRDAARLEHLDRRADEASAQARGPALNALKRPSLKRLSSDSAMMLRTEFSSHTNRTLSAL